MATTLTQAQKLYLFEILEVPYSSSMHELVGRDNLVTKEFGADTVQSAKLQIESWLDTLDTDTETVLKTYIDAWSSLGLQTTLIDGGVGGVQGVGFDPDRKRRLIREKVKVIVPFYRAHDAIEIARNDQRSAAIIR